MESGMRERKKTLLYVVRSSSLSLQAVPNDEMNYPRWHSTRFHTHCSGLQLASHCSLHINGEAEEA